MLRWCVVLLYAALFPGCASPENEAWSPRQRAIAHHLRQAGSLSGWIASTDTIVLLLPDTVRVDVFPRVVATRLGFYLCNAIGRSVVRVTRQGRFVSVFGRTGSGPGEFRSIVAAAADPEGVLYILDNLLARVSCFTPEGSLLRTISIPNPFLVRHLCPVAGGSLYLHHAPDSARGAFVTLVQPEGRKTPLIPSLPEYEAYYFRGHLEGALVADRSGAVYETNAYAPVIRQLRGGDLVRTFGERASGFSPPEGSRGFASIHHLQSAVMSATLVKGLFLVSNEELLLQELIGFTNGGRTIDRRLLVYDTTGIFLGQLAGDAGGIETSDGDAFVRVHNPLPPPDPRPLMPLNRRPRIVVLHVRGVEHD